MSAPIIPLAVAPWPLSSEQISALKRAKDALAAESALPFLLQPCRAVPGSPTRVLALDGVPGFACDSAVVDWRKPASLKNALEWVLDESQSRERGLTVEKWFVGVYPGARYIGEEKVA